MAKKTSRVHKEFQTTVSEIALMSEDIVDAANDMLTVVLNSVQVGQKEACDRLAEKVGKKLKKAGIDLHKEMGLSAVEDDDEEEDEEEEGDEEEDEDSEEAEDEDEDEDEDEKPKKGKKKAKKGKKSKDDDDEDEEEDDEDEEEEEEDEEEDEDEADAEDEDEEEDEDDEPKKGKGKKGAKAKKGKGKKSKDDDEEEDEEEDEGDEEDDDEEEEDLTVKQFKALKPRELNEWFGDYDTSAKVFAAGAPNAKTKDEHVAKAAFYIQEQYNAYDEKKLPALTKEADKRGLKIKFGRASDETKHDKLCSALAVNDAVKKFGKKKK